MKYRLIAIDMDGTFLNEKHTVSQANIEAVKKAIDLGVKVVVATGRDKNGIKPLMEYLDFNNHFILYNGSMIYDSNIDEYIERYDLTFLEAEKVYNHGVELNTTVVVWADDKHYTNSRNSEIIRYYEKLNNEEFIELKNIKDIEHLKIQKVLYSDKAERMLEILKDLENHVFDGCQYEQSFAEAIEFYNKDCSKGNSVLKYAKSLAIDPKEIMAIGDSMNDLSMIRMAGLGVAMGNANESIKVEADFVTKSNTEDGVAYAINKFILNNI